MRKCVFSLLLSLVATACTAPPTPPPEPPPQPLVIGTSPPMPIATSAEPPGPPDEARASLGPSTALAIPARDPRISHGRTTPPSVLATEIQALEALFRATQMTSPDRPALMRRLAEDYAALSRGTSGATSASAHQGALRYYDLLVSEYPKDPQIDEAYYYAGLEHELAGDLPNARRSYYELIKRSPQSKLIPLAYFAFGEMFYAEAANDPAKDDFALQAYAEVLKYPPPGNAVYADAQRRVSEVKARKAGNAGFTRP